MSSRLRRLIVAVLASAALAACEDGATPRAERGDGGVGRDGGAGTEGAADTGVASDAGTTSDRDTGTDAGTDTAVGLPPDAGFDAGRDAGFDAGFDAGRDAGFDAGFDAGRDAGRDASFDAGRDAGRDAGFDAGRDAGHDGGFDAGPDSGTPPTTGFTDLTPPPGARVIYVSTSGSDAADGLSPSTPKRTFGAAYELLRDGEPDQMLLRRGDVWIDEPLPSWGKSGDAASGPMVIGTYGASGARPRIDLSSASAFTNRLNVADLGHVALVGVHFRAIEREAAADQPGILLLTTAGRRLHHVLVEDCVLESFTTGFVSHTFSGGARIQDLRVRRSMILDSFNAGGHSQGIFMNEVDGILLEENVFDHNGWRPGVAEGTIFNHNVYFDTDVSEVTVRGNVFARASSHGIQMRTGGVAEDNLFVQNPINLQVGSHGLAGGASNDPPPGVVWTGVARRNVILEGNDIPSVSEYLPRGWGLMLYWVSDAVAEDNIIAHLGGGGYSQAIQIDTRRAGEVHDLVLRGNIVYDWQGGTVIAGPEGSITNLEFTQNVLVEPSWDEYSLLHVLYASMLGEITSAGNRFAAPGASTCLWMIDEAACRTLGAWQSGTGDVSSSLGSPAFLDPHRSVASYNATLGGAATVEAFLARLRERPRASWDEGVSAYGANAYIREGFETE